MAGITDKLTALNHADLSKLAARLAALRKTAAAGSAQSARTTDALTPQQLLAALEQARQRT